jgi:hypothetical protein
VKVVVAVRAGGHTPVNEIHLKTLCTQEPDQTALGEKIINQHIHRQWRNNDHRRAVAFALNRNGYAVQFDEIFLQRRVIAQADQAVRIKRLEGRLPSLHQAGSAEYAVKRIAGVEACLARQPGGFFSSGFDKIGHRKIHDKETRLSCSACLRYGKTVISGWQCGHNWPLPIACADWYD